MDPLTHSLFGGAAAAAGLGRRTALGAATLVIAANLPDLDVFAYSQGSDAALWWRRGWTHGVLAMVVLPLVLTLLMRQADRLRRRLRRSDAASPPFDALWTLRLAALGVWSHPLLDWLNTYGVRFLMPFDGRWFYGDSLYILDPWVWLMLGGSLFLGHSTTRRSRWSWAVLALLTSAVMILGNGITHWASLVWSAGLAILVAVRLVGGAAPSATPARRGLLLCAVYTLFMVGATEWARRDVHAALAEEGLGDTRLMAGPILLEPLRRDVLVELPESYRVGVWSLLGSPRLRFLPEEIARGNAAPEVLAARGAHCVRGFANWMRFPFYEVEPRADGGETVHLLDARYVRRRQAGFGATAVRRTPSGEIVDCATPPI